MDYRTASKYDPAMFCVPPKKNKGESTKIQCNIQAQHYRALGIVGRSGVFPFQDRADAVRWCIQVGLEKAMEMELHLINTVMRHANIMLELAKIEVFNQKFTEVFTEIQEAVSRYTQKGRPHDLHAAQALIGRMRQQIDLMPDEPESELHWKITYRDELDNRFRHLYMNPN